MEFHENMDSIISYSINLNVHVISLRYATKNLLASKKLASKNLRVPTDHSLSTQHHTNCPTIQNCLQHIFGTLASRGSVDDSVDPWMILS